MKTLKYLIIIYMIILCWLVLFCYSSHAIAGDETEVGEHSSSIKCIDRERKALLRFKEGIASDNCGLLSSWGVIEDCCNWRGIRCSNRTSHVIMLHLQGSMMDVDVYMPCLEGKLDRSLFELTHLKYLDVSNNGFFHSIPNSIDSLTELEYLNLSNGGFFGKIPPQLGNLSKLASLDLSFNSNLVEGSIYQLTTKSLQWLSHLTLLREIHLSVINLSDEATDWRQIINQLPSLKVLYLDFCSLHDILPSSSLSYINSSSSLRVISLSGNFFNDTSIFKWFFNFSRHGNQLEHIDLSQNSLSGPIPSPIGKYMHSLSYLDLSRNSLSGPIPCSFWKYTHSLSFLDLSYNRLEGSIPSTFSNLRSLRVLSLSNNKLHDPFLKNLAGILCHLQSLDMDSNNLDDDVSNVFQALSSGCANKPLLEYLYLGNNQLWGSIPNMISNFSSIRELSLYGNHLNGTLSQNIGQLSMLEILDLSYNSLKATINHNHFLNLSRLCELYLSDNSALVVSIDDDDWIPPFQLKRLESCKLGPSFPNWLLNQSHFSSLDISYAKISGEVPLAFWKKLALSSDLSYLNMSHNNFYGVLPDLSTSLESYVIDLSSNYFEGSIPSIFFGGNNTLLYLNDNMFSDATQLLCPGVANSMIQELYLSNNLLSGRLPNCLMKMDHLVRLHLESNKFFGNIPTSIGYLTQLQFLHLQYNSFSGEVPVSMLNCTDLVYLDLGFNSLTGYIPPSIGNAFTGLSFLNLRGNKFFGKLPLSLCQLSKLHTLDVALNHISGSIPNCIYNLTLMSVSNEPEIDIGNATIEETAIIEWKKEEQRFKQNLLELVYYIDLSYNELEGEIPDGISNLTKLMSLNLARNKLTGSIPSNIGQLTSLELLDLSNNHLSGVIPASLADVSFLGTLDLSNNNLSGRIPLSTQLQGFDPSSYSGNPLLCGAPLQKCAGDESPAGGNIHQEEHGHDNFYLGLCISVVLGFIVGFWGVCGSLVVKRRWRHAFFSFFGDIKDKIYVIAVVNVARIWRKD